MAVQSAVVLDVKALEKSFGEGDVKTYALRGVDLSVKAGVFMSIMGPSGSGKTTLLTLMGGIDSPTSGQVLLEGHDLATMDDAQLASMRRQRIGFVFQAFNLLPILTAEDNIILPLIMDGVPRSKALKLAEELMEQLGIIERRGNYPSNMSGGEQQRVAICRAMIAKPPIIFADEPTGNLDSARSSDLIKTLRSLVDDFGKTLVMVTHDVSMAVYSDQVTILRDGRIQCILEGDDVTEAKLLEYSRTPSK